MAEPNSASEPSLDILASHTRSSRAELIILGTDLTVFVTEPKIDFTEKI